MPELDAPHRAADAPHRAADHGSISDMVNDAVTRIAVLAGLAGTALTHVLELPEVFAEKGYVGALFICVIVASLVLAAVLTRTSDRRATIAAGGLGALVLLGYVLSRTTGLPDATYAVGEWSEPLALVSMVAEGLLVCVAAAVLATDRHTSATAVARPIA